MRKISVFLLALLLMVGVANATNIPGSSEPKNFPTVWTEEVYNGSGSSITSGYIVVWDFDTADSTENWNDDRCPYVKTAVAVDSVWVAGVVTYGQNIANGATGTIIIKGPAFVIDGVTGTDPIADQMTGNDATGHAIDWTGTNEAGSIGVCIKADPAAAANGPDDGAVGWCIIYVNPTTFD